MQKDLVSTSDICKHPKSKELGRDVATKGDVPKLAVTGIGFRRVLNLKVGGVTPNDIAVDSHLEP